MITKSLIVSMPSFWRKVTFSKRKFKMLITMKNSINKICQFWNKKYNFWKRKTCNCIRTSKSWKINRKTMRKIQIIWKINTLISKINIRSCRRKIKNLRKKLYFIKDNCSNLPNWPILVGTRMLLKKRMQE